MLNDVGDTSSQRASRGIADTSTEFIHQLLDIDDTSFEPGRLSDDVGDTSFEHGRLLLDVYEGPEGQTDEQTDVRTDGKTNTTANSFLCSRIIINSRRSAA